MTASPSADAAAYDHKHNEDNGEEGRDGQDDNRAWNDGVEGRPRTGPDPGGPPAAGRSATCWHVAFSVRGPDDRRRRRPGRTQERQQQRLLPGQRDLLAGLGAGRPGSSTCWPRPGACWLVASRARRAAAAAVLRRAARAAPTAPPTWPGSARTAADGPADRGTTPTCGPCRCTSTARTSTDVRCWSSCTAARPRSRSRCRSTRHHDLRAALGQRPGPAGRSKTQRRQGFSRPRGRDLDDGQQPAALRRELTGVRRSRPGPARPRRPAPRAGAGSARCSRTSRSG